MSVCAIHSFNEGGYIVWLQERGDFHTRARACGGISAGSGRRGGAGRGDRVAYRPVHCVVWGGGVMITDGCCSVPCWSDSIPAMKRRTCCGEMKV